MLSENARVVNVVDDVITLEVTDADHCQSCIAKSGCGHSLLSKLHIQRKGTVTLVSEGFDGVVGSSAEIALPENQLVLLSLIVYGFPLLVMIVLLLIATTLGLAEPLIVSFAFLGLGFGFFAINLAQKVLSSRLSVKLIGL